MEKVYKVKGVCSRSVAISLDGNRIGHVCFDGGCSGNTQGIAKLVEGMDAGEAISRLKGIRCGRKDTSCPDQLAIALEKALREEKENGREVPPDAEE